MEIRWVHSALGLAFRYALTELHVNVNVGLKRVQLTGSTLQGVRVKRVQH